MKIVLPRRARLSAVAALSLTACLPAALTAGTAAAARRPAAAPARLQVSTNEARTLPAALLVAARAGSAADRSFVGAARRLRRCHLAHPVQSQRCAGAHGALQRAGTRLRHARRRFSRLVRQSSAPAGRTRRTGQAARAEAAGNADRTPVLSVSGQTLTWTHISTARTYLVMTAAPGQRVTYSLVQSPSLTPPPVPGANVTYRVRTGVFGSEWSDAVSISYPAVPVGEEAPDPLSAPTLLASGRTLTWNAVADVQTYVLSSEVQGHAPQYSVVGGTSDAPPAVAGARVTYMVRTAEEGSAWSAPVTISYPPESSSKGEEAPSGEGAVRQVIIGVVDASGWGSEVAGRVREAGFLSERLEAGNPWGDTMALSYSYGFRGDQIIVGNTPDGTPLSQISIGPWVSTALAQVEEAASYGYTLLEVGNEMYLKGSQAEPVKYAEMYMALANAVDAAKITGVTLLFDSFGDYELPSGEWSLTADGRGWLGDALRAEPALKQRAQAFSDHPYDVRGTKYWNNDWGMEGLRTQHAAAISMGFEHTDVYATEFGEKDRSPGTVAGAQEQAENLKWGYEELLSMPYVKGIWCYTLHEDGSGEDFGLVTGNWEPRPALTVLEGFLHSVPQ